MLLFGSQQKGIPMPWKEWSEHQTKYIHQLSTPYSIWRTFFRFENGWREPKLSHKVKGPKRVELYTAVLPAVFSVSVFCRYQICWIFGISVGIDPPLFCILPPFPPPFFPKGGGASQKGGHCPPFEEKGGHCPLFDTEMYRPNFPSVSVW